MLASLADALPGKRPLLALPRAQIDRRFARALARADGVEGAHCIHELWMRGEMGIHIDAALRRLWQAAGDSIPEWLPMRHVGWLSQVYEVAGRWHAKAKGRTHIYLVLLDPPALDAEHGIYVGMSKYPPAQRFDQHKAGIRAAGSVLKHGLEVLTGPTLHLQFIRRGEAERIEAGLAADLADAGLWVKGGH
jgi:hypothetical protein